MKILTPEQILVLHEEMIRKYGGSSGIRDRNMFLSAIYRPFATFGGRDLYPDIYFKAGALIQAVIKDHPFIDGNKRTAFAVTFVFLRKNGIDLEIKKSDGVKFMVDVANKNLSVEEISNWIKRHSEKI